MKHYFSKYEGSDKGRREDETKNLRNFEKEGEKERKSFERREE